MGKNTNDRANDKCFILTVIGLIIMLLLSLTQLLPSLRLAGYSVFVGIAFFFFVEAVSKMPNYQSGLRFRSLISDMKKPGVLIWVLLPVATAIVSPLLGDWLFSSEYTAHVIGRAGSILAYDHILALVFQVPVLALGEEIAWRGFFIGKSLCRFPFWLCAVVSSVLFAIGHIASGNIVLVIFDVAFVFLDSMIFSIVFKKSGNCLVSTISHIIGNAVGMLFCFSMI